MYIVSLENVLIINFFYVLLGFSPSSPIIFGVINECVTLESIKTYTNQEFNRSIPTTTSRATLTSFWVIWNTLFYVISP
jgi:hypothetical protein